MFLHLPLQLHDLACKKYFPSRCVFVPYSSLAKEFMGTLCRQTT